MRLLSIAILGAVFLGGSPLAHGQEIVTTVGVEEVITAFSEAGLMGISDRTLAADTPVISAVRDDLFTIEAILHACADGRCSGVTLTIPVPVRDQDIARAFESTIDSNA